MRQQQIFTFARPLSVLAVILCLGLAGVFAQSGEALELTDTYTTRDGTFQFRYPAEWTLEEGSNGDLTLTGSGAEVILYPPVWVQSASLFMGDFSDAAGLLEAHTAMLVEGGLMEMEPFETITLETGTAARGGFTVTSDGATNQPVQFMLAAPAGDHFALFTVWAEDDEPVSSTLYAMAESFVVFEDAIPTQVPMNIEIIRQPQPVELSETYVTDDGAFQFNYPSDWDVEERPDGALDLSGPEGQMTIYPPNYLVVTDLFTPDLRTPATLMDSWMEATEAAGVAVYDTPTKVMLTTEQTAVRADFEFTRADATGPGQFMFAAPATDTLALLLVLERDIPAMEEIAYAIAASFIVLDDTPPQDADTGGLSEAVGLPTSWQENVALLEDLGLIEGDGELLWSNDYMTTVLGGPFLLDDDSLSNYPNIAGGVFVSFRPEEDISTCGLMARVNSEPGSEQALFVGLSGLYELIVMHVSPETVDDPPVEWVDNELSFFNPQQLMYVLRDNHVTILINGEIVAEDIEVTLPEPDAKGDAPVGRAGALLEMSCVMTDAWAYGFGE